jgi:magnesium chelatase family protein
VARLVDGLEVLGVGSLGQLVAVFRGDPVPEIELTEGRRQGPTQSAGRSLDVADVGGEVEAQWAVESRRPPGTT